MSKDKSDPVVSGDRDIFNVPGQSMSEDVSDAARILRGFVSHLTPTTGGSQDSLYATTDDTPIIDPFEIPGANVQNAPHDGSLDALMQKADQVSNSLTDAMEFVPRVVEGASGVFSLHPKDDEPVARRHPPIRLRYKGKASKKQLERLRRRIQQHAQSA